MRELSLFTGSGFGLLGTKLLGFRPIGYVEWTPFRQAVLAQRIKDGFLEKAPIFGDIREFVKSGAAREYRGFADVVTGGPPCQPHSQAGKQLGGADPRDMWPATRDVLRDVRPVYALLENVSGLVASGYLATIIGNLAELGYSAKWGMFPGSSEGALHERERIFILATDDQQKRQQGHIEKALPWKPSLPWGENVGGLEELRTRPGIPEPLFRRMGDGGAHSMDRVGAAGDAQIPCVVRRAWHELSQ